MSPRHWRARARFFATCIALVALSGCSYTLKGNLLNPFNRDLSGTSEDNAADAALRLLNAGASAPAVVAILQQQGLSKVQAERAVALALVRKAE